MNGTSKRNKFKVFVEWAAALWATDSILFMGIFVIPVLVLFVVSASVYDVVETPYRYLGKGALSLDEMSQLPELTNTDWFLNIVSKDIKFSPDLTASSEVFPVSYYFRAKTGTLLNGQLTCSLVL